MIVIVHYKVVERLETEMRLRTDQGKNCDAQWSHLL